MGDTAIAVGLAVIFSLLIGIIELRYRTKASFTSCLTSSAVVYIAILLVGNTATTLTAAATVTKVFTTPPPATPATNPPFNQTGEKVTKHPEHPDFSWFWFAFLGVFGFEILLQNINLTFAGKGVLSINDWITKARDSAEAAAIKAEADASHDRAQILAQKLMAIPESQLNTYILALLHKNAVELDEAAANAGADPVLYKALALAYGAPDQAAAIK